MTRWKLNSTNVALNTTIQMSGVLRRYCVDAYNTVAHNLGIDTLRRVTETLRAAPQLRRGSSEFEFLCNYIFFAADSVLGERRVFARQFQDLVRHDMRVFRAQIMASPFAAWECVGHDTQAREGSLWRAIGRPDANERADLAPTYSPTGVRALTGADATPLRAQLGDIRAGWLVNLADLAIGSSARFRQDLAGCSALLFSHPLAPKAGERLKETAARRGWHGQVGAGHRAFMRADYERDILTQVASPDYRECGLGAYYYLPVSLRKSFPNRFFTEITRRLTSASGADTPLWHVQIARACDEQARAELFDWFETLRTSVEERVNYYSSDRVEPHALRTLLPDEQLLAWMGVSPDVAIDLSAFAPLASQPVEMLDLPDAWLDKTQLNAHIPISRARRSLEDRHKRLRQEFESSVTRHLARMRWVSLITYHRALAEGDAALTPPPSNLRKLGFELDLPGYAELRHVAQQLFGPTLNERPIREVFAPLKGRLAKLESAIHLWRERAKLDPKEQLTLADLPMSKSRLESAAGIGPTTVDAIESLLLDELLAWPRNLAKRPIDAQQADERLGDGLDELDDLFG